MKYCIGDEREEIRVRERKKLEKEEERGKIWKKKCKENGKVKVVDEKRPWRGQIGDTEGVPFITKDLGQRYVPKEKENEWNEVDMECPDSMPCTIYDDMVHYS